MQPSPARDLVVGLFVLAGLAALAYLSIQVGGVSYTGPGGLRLYATFEEVGGLKPRAPIAIAGVKVGQVAAIELDPVGGTRPANGLGSATIGRTGVVAARREQHHRGDDPPEPHPISLSRGRARVE